MAEGLLLGIDIGSTTAKAVLRRGEEILFSKYERHFSQVREKTVELLEEIAGMIGDEPVTAAVSGSAGLGLAEAAGLPFVQEVFATAETVRRLEPDASCVIELGGEDAKIIFFEGGLDQRMNGSCAGGTGAFIDQMATLLNLTVGELDTLSRSAERIYPIASRCGVFAKTDIQPLLNQGARKEDVAASIYQAVVNQTVAGLAQGRRIAGRVLFLGGPLYYCSGLRTRFCETLKLSEEDAVFPEYGRTAVALGASIYAETSGLEDTAAGLIRRVRESRGALSTVGRMEPLFRNEEEYRQFAARHARADVGRAELEGYAGDAYLGIDCGSTTTKLVLLSEDNEILYSYYASNQGNPVEIVREQLQKLYALCGDRVHIRGSAVTGYGEELIKHAFSVDCGLVETVAHFTAARHFQPDVDFILDIGGQDIKCFRIKNGAIDSIMLNEACSSGCGSFLETFAKSMGYSVADFAAKGLYGPAPVNLGSRCTVFMNSSVKQSQKDGASVEDISAGLSISVVKNAVYKVIRAARAEELGEHIVVQGGTFYNDAVLRAFEREMGREVIRPAIAGLMGAYGAALYSRRCGESSLISPEELAHFTHTAKAAVCQGCENHCNLTVNRFGDGRSFVSGNQCERGATGRRKNSEEIDPFNLYEHKLRALTAMQGGSGKRCRVGLPLTLDMYEFLPLWYGFFSALGAQVVLSKPSTRATYERGQFSIPSDTACYPAKLMHGHIVELSEQGVDFIFYPSLTYNIKELYEDQCRADNHYNCPIVAYYAELLNCNVESEDRAQLIYPHLNLNNSHRLVRDLYSCLSPHFEGLKYREVRRCLGEGVRRYEEYMERIRSLALDIIARSREAGRPIMVLAGRPYHVDPEVSHGIDRLAVELGFSVVSEDSVAPLANLRRAGVLDQWTFHDRLYRAAEYAASQPDTELVQLVSFGCGMDAITTDEARELMESRGKLYTQIKIDEINNLGAVKIRLRSLLGAMEERKRKSDEALQTADRQATA